MNEWCQISISLITSYLDNNVLRSLLCKHIYIHLDCPIGTLHHSHICCSYKDLYGYPLVNEGEKKGEIKDSDREETLITSLANLGEL